MASTAQVNFSLSICARLCDGHVNFSCVPTAMRSLSIKSTSPPPLSVNPAPVPLSTPLSVSLIQHFPIGDTRFQRYPVAFLSVDEQTLKKQPVDPVALNIPHYPFIVKTRWTFYHRSEVGLLQSRQTRSQLEQSPLLQVCLSQTSFSSLHAQV